MAQAPRDQNRVTTLLGVSNIDGVTPVTIWVDPVTHRVLTTSSSSVITRYFLYRILDPLTNTSVTSTLGGALEIPLTGTITEVGAYVDTAGTTGTMSIDVNLNGITIMSATKITIDSNETSSRTAITPPVLTTTSVTVGDLFTFDVDAIQTTPAKGLTIRIGIQ